MDIEKLRIGYPCPECQLRFSVSIRQLQEGGVIICPRCRATNAQEELKEIERHLDELGRSLHNLRQNLEADLRARQQL